MTSKSTAAGMFRAIARSRRSTRRFDPERAIPAPVLRDILETTNTSPSGFNLQPTQVIIVRSPDLKSRLANEAMLGGGNAYRAADASALAVFLSDLELRTRIDRIYKLERDAGVRDPHYMSILPVAASFLTGEGVVATGLKRMATDALSPVQPMPTVESVEAWSCKNTSLMAQTYTLAAASHGLASCMMEGYDSRRLKKILRIPERYGVPLVVATGYEYEGEGWVGETDDTPRLGLEEVFFGDTFGGELDVLWDSDASGESLKTEESSAAVKPNA